MEKLLRFVIIASSFILTACAVAPKQMYDGPRLKAESEAVLIGDVGVFITAVDGKSALDVPALMATQMYPYPDCVFVLQGRHEISVKFVADRVYPFSKVVDDKLRFEAEAGKTYLIKATIRHGSSASFWIEDASTGHAVERH